MICKNYKLQEEKRQQWVNLMMECVEQAARQNPDLTSEDILLIYDNLPKSKKVQYSKSGSAFTSILNKAKKKGLIEIIAGSYRRSTSRSSQGKSLQLWKSKVYDNQTELSNRN